MISHPSTSGRQRTVEFQALPSRTGQVRRIVSAHLRYWKLDALVAPASSAVAELLSDVHRHVGADRRCTVEIALRPDELTISVCDDDPRLPSVHPTGFPSGETGRAPRDGTGKTMWFTLAVPAQAVPVDDSVDPAGTAGPTARPAGRRSTDDPLSEPPLPPPDPTSAPDPLPRFEPLPRSQVAVPVRAGAGAPARPA